jgi:hypothetical protein
MNKLDICRLTISMALLPCAPLLAQENSSDLEFHSCTGELGGGFDWVRGSDSDALKHHAGVFQAGGGFAVSRRVAIVADFMFYGSGIQASALMNEAGSPQGGSAKFYSTILEPTFILTAHRRYNLYAFGGFGWLRRSIKFTNPGETLVHPGGVEVPGGGSANSGTADAGAGIDIRLNRAGLRGYIEARYVHGLGRNLNTTLLPLTAGVRW